MNESFKMFRLPFFVCSFTRKVNLKLFWRIHLYLHNVVGIISAKLKEVVTLNICLFTSLACEFFLHILWVDMRIYIGSCLCTNIINVFLLVNSSVVSSPKQKFKLLKKMCLSFAYDDKHWITKEIIVHVVMSSKQNQIM